MIITINRLINTDRACIGDLLVDGQFLCHTLEDTVRLDNPFTPQDEGAKTWGQTAIPAGEYDLIVNVSPRFKKALPRLLAVPGFEGILIHGGNTVEDTHGCILVGRKVDGETIVRGTSTPALNELMEKLTFHQGPVVVKIVNRFLGGDL